MTDELDATEVGDVRAFWTRLGLPGLVDAHVHFMPMSVMRKVWAYFDAVAMPDGGGWPIDRYRADDASRLAQLDAFGVRAFPTLIYAHRPDMAQWLNDWAREFAAAHPQVLQTATFFPEPGAAAYTKAALDAGARVVKVHLQVGGYDPRDPLLDDVWGLIADARVPVVAHVASGPTPGSFTGPGPISEVLRRHPRLRLVIAHLGMPEYAEFLDLAERHADVWLDTTMAFTDFTERYVPFPTEARARLVALQNRVVLGSDYPNIPHRYLHQLDALQRLELGDDWLRAVCHHNGTRLFELT
ncbi:MAG: amidohydrolase family protein [Mycobacteriales bacterium]|nr:amidohydrolase [Frankia sp.]